MVTLELTPEKQLSISKMFDSYIKRCCKNELRNIERYNKRIKEREVSVENFTCIKVERTIKGLALPDFIVNGFEIAVDDQLLLKALKMLEPGERELILLLFFMGFKPKDISEDLDVVERTVYNRQKKIIRKLKKFMEEQK